jgi:hypothetical protein
MRKRLKARPAVRTPTMRKGAYRFPRSQKRDLRPTHEDLCAGTPAWAIRQSAAVLSQVRRKNKSAPNLGHPFLCLGQGSYAASSARVRARTCTPLPIHAGEAYSSGRWLTPPRQGMKSMATGAKQATKEES